MLLHGEISRKERIMFFHLRIINRRLFQMQEQIKKYKRKFLHLKSRRRELKTGSVHKFSKVFFSKTKRPTRKLNFTHQIQKKKKIRKNVILLFRLIFIPTTWLHRCRHAGYSCRKVPRELDMEN